MAAANVEDVLAPTHTHSVQVPLVDLTLPGQSGAGLARVSPHMQPQLQILLTSGYGTEAEIGESIVGVCPFGRPIDLMTLQQALAPRLSITAGITDTQNVTDAAQLKYPVTDDLARPFREYHPRTTCPS